MPENRVSVRPPRPEDAAVVLRWRNDPVTRAMSRTADPVSPERHADFWRRIGSDPDLIYFMGETDGGPFGVIAFERIDGEWEVSTHVGPEHRGRGLARSLVQEGIRAAFPQGVPLLRAEIKAENTPSRRVFESLGFAPVATRDSLRIYERRA